MIDLFLLAVIYITGFATGIYFATQINKKL